jgi:hypothetical protein
MTIRGMMRGSLVPVALLLVLATSGARAEQAIDTFQTPGWSGAAYADPTTGKFTYCDVSSAFGGAVLTFSLDRDQQFRVEVGAEDWRLTPHSDYVTTLMIDHHEPLQTIAQAAAQKQLVVEFGPDDDIVKELRNGQFLRVLAEHVGLSFSLSGSSDALVHLRSCVMQHGGTVGAPR